MKHILQPALDHSGTQWADVENDLGSGLAQLWVATDPEPVAALVSRRDGNTLEIWLCAGRVVNAADQFLSVIERAAKQDGMTDARLSGRTGWRRHLAKWGWTMNDDDLVKAL